MADTVLTLITDTLLDMGVLANSAQPTAQQTTQALRKLNGMLETWSIEGLLTYGISINILPLVSGKQIYTLGVGGDLNIPYPNSIINQTIRNTSLPATQQQDYPLYRYNDEEWSNVAFKSQQSAWPNWGIWFNETYPLMKANVLPIPTNNQYSIVLWVEDNIGNYTSNTTLTLSPGYRRAITTNLYLELAPSYSIQVDEQARQNAIQSKAIIQSNNLQINQLVPNFSNAKWYDIVTNKVYNVPG